MTMRRVARGYNREVHCHGDVMSRDVASGRMTLRQAVQRLQPDERRAVMQWWTKGGPFWEADRRHGPDDWFECRDEIVTNSTLGEAAYRQAVGIDCDVISFSPSEWTDSPLSVTWCRDDDELDDLRLDIANSWDAAALEARLHSAAPAIRSWRQLEERSRGGLANLTFGPSCFVPLQGLPFSDAAATRIRLLLGILNRFAGAFDADGSRNVEGLRIQADYFVGRNALFSDSSDTEKRDFGDKMRFQHPEAPGQALSCTWHGKINQMALRIHFSWPVRADEPLYVMYIGQKITRR